MGESEKPDRKIIDITDKMAQGKKGKTAPEQSMDKGGSGPAEPPVEEQPAEPTLPPRPVEEQKIVYSRPETLTQFYHSNNEKRHN